MVSNALKPCDMLHVPEASCENHSTITEGVQMNTGMLTARAYNNRKIMVLAHSVLQLKELLVRLVALSEAVSSLELLCWVNFG